MCYARVQEYVLFLKELLIIVYLLKGRTCGSSAIFSQKVIWVYFYSKGICTILIYAKNMLWKNKVIRSSLYRFYNHFFVSCPSSWGSRYPEVLIHLNLQPFPNIDRITKLIWLKDDSFLNAVFEYMSFAARVCIYKTVMGFCFLVIKVYECNRQQVSTLH